MSELRKAIAIDFDGCLCKNMWPDIGPPTASGVYAYGGGGVLLWDAYNRDWLAYRHKPGDGDNMKIEVKSAVPQYLLDNLLLAASGHCCDICARKAECADAAQVTCCSAFRYYKTEEA